MSEITKLVSYLGVLGIPSIFAMTVWCVRQCDRYTKQLIILMKAQKAQMRAQLIEDFRIYESRGYITDTEAKEWQNQYRAYHELVGDNGILDAKYEAIKTMPNIPPANNTQTGSN